MRKSFFGLLNLLNIASKTALIYNNNEKNTIRFQHAGNE